MAAFAVNDAAKSRSAVRNNNQDLRTETSLQRKP